jgi:hypothetical protein
MTCNDCKQHKDNIVISEGEIALCADCWWVREYPEMREE